MADAIVIQIHRSGSRCDDAVTIVVGVVGEGDVEAIRSATSGTIAYRR